MDALALSRMMHFVLVAHAKHSSNPEDAFRRWDGKTPHAVHPIWCATTFLQETAIPQGFREVGWQALLCHGIIENTKVKLTDFPDGISPQVAELVWDMSFVNFEDEMKQLWTKSKWVRLLKVYDRTSDLQDELVRHEAHIAHLSRLCDDVEENFGRLNILRIARAIIAEPQLVS